VASSASTAIIVFSGLNSTAAFKLCPLVGGGGAGSVHKGEGQSWISASFELERLASNTLLFHSLCYSQFILITTPSAGGWKEPMAKKSRRLSFILFLCMYVPSRSLNPAETIRTSHEFFLST